MRFWFVLAAALAAALATGCAGDGSTAAAPTPSPTASASPLPTATATDTATPTGTSTASPTRTATASPTRTASPSHTATPTATSTPTPSATPTPTASATATQTETATTTPTTVAPVAVDAQLFTELGDVGLDRYLGRPVPTPTVEGPWLRYDFATSDDGPICLYGTPFRVYVRPGTTDDVLLYLEGGGGCWNSDNCWVRTRAKIDAAPLLPLTILRAGVFSSNPQTNPLAGWNVVYVPYCDGSVFTGDNIADYPRGRVWHRGLSNLSTGVDVMRAMFPDPRKIVVSGSSAGGFGTFSVYRVTRRAYPAEEIVLLNDSGPGIQSYDAPRALADRRENWRFEQFRPASCPDCATQPAFITNWAMRFDPRLRGGFFSSLQDGVIRNFLELSGPEYEALLLEVTDEIVRRNPDRAKRFMVAGDFHTILLGGGLGNDGVAADYRTLAVDGVRLPQWIEDLVEDRPGWADLVEGR